MSLTEEMVDEWDRNNPYYWTDPVAYNRSPKMCYRSFPFNIIAINLLHLFSQSSTNYHYIDNQSQPLPYALPCSSCEATG